MTTTDALRLTERHSQIQARIAGRALLDMMPIWRTLDPDDLDRSFPAYARLMREFINANRGTSARVSVAYLAAFREASAIFLPFQPALADPVAAAALTASLRVTGPVSVKVGMRMGRTTAAAMAVAASQTAGAVLRHVLNGGRDTIHRSVLADPAASGVARVTSGKSCAFCAMLASRGTVYKSEMTATFDAHDKCDCKASPVYDSRAQDWARLYKENAKGKKNPLNAFRNAYDYELQGSPYLLV